MVLVDAVKLSKSKCSEPIRAELRYATERNFVGRPINGYTPGLTNLALLTPKAAEKLCAVQNYLIAQHQYGLMVFDAYRPKRAVLDFMAWSQQPPAGAYELERKAKHYPHIEKNELFVLGYVMEDSGHCYGNTVDVVLIDLAADQLLDMGARFDYMDERSHITMGSAEIGEAAFKHRKILQQAMMQFDFQPYHEEFWHFSHGGSAGREVSAPLDIEINADAAV